MSIQLKTAPLRTLRRQPEAGAFSRGQYASKWAEPSPTDYTEQTRKS